MNANLNMTYLQFGGHVDVHRFKYLYFLIMFTAFILIVCFNATIICLIVVHKNLHEPMYVFIAALLLNSLLFSTNICPKLLIDFLSEKQVISYQACLFQVFMFYSLSASEFLLLSAMSFDRYLSICKPLQYPTIMRKKTVIFLLALAWLVPACHISVPVVLNFNTELCSSTLKGIFCNNSVTTLFCVIPKVISIYGVINLFNLGLFPMLFILLSYIKIIIIAYQSCGDIRRKATQTCLPHLLVLINFSILITNDVVIVKLESDFPKTARFVMTLQMITCNPLCNPIIYGLKMKEISKHLKTLFRNMK